MPPYLMRAGKRRRKKRQKEKGMSLCVIDRIEPQGGVQLNIVMELVEEGELLRG
jgi:hypothetical protein